jgi:hypothetical protein
MKISDVIEAPEKEIISINSKILPEVKDWKVGKTYNVNLKVRLTSLSEGWDEPKRLRASFEVLKADCDEKE